MPAAHKNYTVAFNIQKEIATSTLNNYTLASIRASSVTRYPECSNGIYVISDMYDMANTVVYR
jgi:hypothetical protein